MNKVLLSGYLAKDPEVKQTPTGKTVCQFTLAVAKPTKEKTADFLLCTAWQKLAEIVGQYLKKGSYCIVSGRLTSRHYEDKNGQHRTIVEVVVEDLDFGPKVPAKKPDAAERFGPGVTVTYYDSQTGQPVEGGGQPSVTGSFAGDYGFTEIPEPDGDLPF